jgi:D-glycero-D-manno-heptose 1,7-bisphosphate phosphatase
MNKAVFLDRDGTINKEVEYLSSPDDLKLLPETVKALKLLQEKDFKLVVITNQAGIARGYFSEEDYLRVEKKLSVLLEDEGVKLLATYFCPHHPDFGENRLCDCRKPNPGMITKACNEHDIELSESYMIGDKASDILAGINAGVKNVILVETGYGKTELEKLSQVENLEVCENLLAAAKKIVGE